jgi:hypothetical protein
LAYAKDLLKQVEGGVAPHAIHLPQNKSIKTTSINSEKNAPKLKKHWLVGRPILNKH